MSPVLLLIFHLMLSIGYLLVLVLTLALISLLWCAAPSSLLAPVNDILALESKVSGPLLLSSGSPSIFFYYSMAMLEPTGSLRK